MRALKLLLLDLLLLLLLLPSSSPSSTPPFGKAAVKELLKRLDSKRASPSIQEAAARGVLKRLLPTHLSSFRFEIAPKVDSRILIYFFKKVVVLMS